MRILREALFGYLTLLFYLFGIVFAFPFFLDDSVGWGNLLAIVIFSTGYLMILCNGLYILPLFGSDDAILMECLPLRPTLLLNRMASQLRWRYVVYSVSVPLLIVWLLQVMGIFSVWSAVNLMLTMGLCILIPLHERLAGFSWTIVFFLPRLAIIAFENGVYRVLSKRGKARNPKFRDFFYTLTIILAALALRMPPVYSRCLAFVDGISTRPLQSVLAYFLLPSSSFIRPSEIDGAWGIPSVIAGIQVVLLICVILGIRRAWRRLDADWIAKQDIAFRWAIKDEKLDIEKAMNIPDSPERDRMEFPYIEGASPEKHLARADWHWMLRDFWNDSRNLTGIRFRLLLGLIAIITLFRGIGWLGIGRTTTISCLVALSIFYVGLWLCDVSWNIGIPRLDTYGGLPVRPMKAVALWWRREWIRVVAWDFAMTGTILLFFPSLPKTALIYFFCLSLTVRLFSQFWRLAGGLGEMSIWEKSIAYVLLFVIAVSTLSFIFLVPSITLRKIDIDFTSLIFWARYVLLIGCVTTGCLAILVWNGYRRSHGVIMGSFRIPFGFVEVD
jgi:hypothetical protein